MKSSSPRDKQLFVLQKTKTVKFSWIAEILRRVWEGSKRCYISYEEYNIGVMMTAAWVREKRARRVATKNNLKDILMMAGWECKYDDFYAKFIDYGESV